MGFDDDSRVLYQDRNKLGFKLKAKQDEVTLLVDAMVYAKRLLEADLPGPALEVLKLALSKYVEV